MKLFLSEKKYNYLIEMCASLHIIDDSDKIDYLGLYSRHPNEGSIYKTAIKADQFALVCFDRFHDKLFVIQINNKEHTVTVIERDPVNNVDVEIDEGKEVVAGKEVVEVVYLLVHGYCLTKLPNLKADTLSDIEVVYFDVFRDIQEIKPTA